MKIALSDGGRWGGRPYFPCHTGRRFSTKARAACWPAARQEHWLALLKARAIENQCYVAAVNRVGSDPWGLSYSGGSQIIDPRGQVLADAGQGDFVIQADISLDFVRRYRHEFPSLSDMRLIGQGPGS